MSSPTEAVRARRLQLGFSQAQLGRATGTGQPSIARIEAGHVPTLVVLERIATALGCALMVDLVPLEAPATAAP